MNTARALYVCTTLLLGCAPQPQDAPSPGSLELSLASEAGGSVYQLSQARFTLEGPLRRDFAAGDEATLVLEELPPGAYTLTLLDDYTLSRSGDAGASQVEAHLVSENPAPVLISPGQTTQLSLRFELGRDTSAQPPGKLAIGLAVDAQGADAGASCAQGLRIAELDYEQAGTDEAEFVEIVNTGSCASDLKGVALELINGGDGQVYARYDLAASGAQLPAGARLVIGDAAVLAALPNGTANLPLNGSGLQNGPDAVRLVLSSQVIDALSYEGDVPGVAGSAAPADEGEQALARCPDGFDSGDAALDFRLVAPSPGSPNACQ